MTEKPLGRRAFLRLTGAAAAAAVTAGDELLSRTAKNFSDRLANFLSYNQIKITEIPNAKFLFHGNAHRIPTLVQHLTEYVESIKRADFILCENTAYTNQEEPLKKYVDMSIEELQTEMVRLSKIVQEGETEPFPDFFAFLQVIVAKFKKPIICTDPNMFYDYAELENIERKINKYATVFEKIKFGALGGTFTGLGMTMAGVLSDKEQLEHIGLLTTFGSAGIREGSKLNVTVDDAIVERTKELLLYSKEIQQTSLGKTLLEFSVLNFRDFTVAANIHHLNDISGGSLKDSNITAFYGSAHFQIQQILKLPRWIIEKKMELYRLIAPEIGAMKSNIKRYDPSSQKWELISGVQNQ